MNICHVWPNFLPYVDGGLEHYILDLSTFLSESDANFCFALLADKSNMRFSTSCTKPIFNRFGPLEIYWLGPNLATIINNIFFRFRIKSPFLEKIILAALFREAINLKAVSETDIFHVHGIWETRYPLLGLYLSRYFNRPMIVSLHGESVNISEISMRFETSDSLSVLMGAKIITTYSQEVFSKLRELGFGEKSILIPNFRNIKKFCRPVKKLSEFCFLKNRVVLVSRLDYNKNPLNIIQAFNLVTKVVPDAKLQIIGDGPLYKSVQFLIRELDLQNSVKLYGRQSNVRKFLWNNNIFIATNASYLALLEAWAAGLAVIAPKLGITRNLVKDQENGLLVDYDSAEEIANALIKLINSPDLQKKLIFNGMDNVKKYDIENVTPVIAKIYSDLNQSC
jgi:glycosyltransferase involved in cell wall biosynthesis